MQLLFAPGTNMKRMATAVAAVAARGDLRGSNLIWQDKTQYEHEVNPLQRFLVDASLSGGARALALPRPK
jgi:hypothetical protein